MIHIKNQESIYISLVSWIIENRMILTLLQILWKISSSAPLNCEIVQSNEEINLFQIRQKSVHKTKTRIKKFSFFHNKFHEILSTMPVNIYL